MKKRLIFLGPPGAGKGTQAERICKKMELLHLSTGDLLRAEVSAGTSLGKEASDLMNKGELVSNKIVLSIVEKKLSHEYKLFFILIYNDFPKIVINVSKSLSFPQKLL